MGFITTGLAITAYPNSEAANQPAGQFTMTLPQAIDVSNGKWRVSLAFYQIWYTVDNISAKKGNNQIVYYDVSMSGLQTLTIPDGGWAISDIATYFTANVSAGAAANIVFSKFLNTGTQVRINTTGYYVDFSSGAPAKLASILGFLPQVYPSDMTSTGNFISQNQANITDGLNSFLISFPGLVDPSYSYSPNKQGAGQLTTGSVLYQGSFGVQFGFRQSVEPQNPIPLPVLKSMKQIQTINVLITDQNGNILDFGQNGDYTNNSSSFTLLFEQSAHIDEPGKW